MRSDNGNFGVNLIGVVVATVIGMILGAVWYSPVLFGNRWMQCIGKTPETLGSPTGPMIGSVFASLMSAVGVSLVHAYIGVDSLSMGIGMGLILGVLIVFPALLSDNLFCGWGTELLLIQSGYRILSVLLMSIAVTYIG